jgi:hypothetical protein
MAHPATELSRAPAGIIDRPWTQVAVVSEAEVKRPYHPTEKWPLGCAGYAAAVAAGKSHHAPVLCLILAWTGMRINTNRKLIDGSKLTLGPATVKNRLELGFDVRGGYS